VIAARRRHRRDRSTPARDMRGVLAVIDHLKRRPHASPIAVRAVSDMPSSGDESSIGLAFWLNSAA